ncbi:MAG: prenyltransferase [Thermoplasmata archaeon]|nr:prenyltransferase [Thermoplasmata archaeon]
MSKVTDSANQDAKITLKGIITLSRLPFLLPGLAALITGISLAIIEGYVPDFGLIALSLIGLALIMLATYYYNEYFDYEGDIINRTFTQFSGGSRAIPNRLVPRSIARIAGISSVVILFAIMVIFFLFYFEKFSLLLPMALIGAFCGIFYSHPPFQWAYRGIGEILIGGCYGVLAVVSGFYLISGVLSTDMVIIAIPASLTIFGVIVANEFPDIEADRAVNKRTIVVRLGLKRGSQIYSIAMLLAYPCMLLSIATGFTPLIALAGLPVLLLSLGAVIETVRGGYDKMESQKKISGFTLITNLSSSLLFIPAALIG